MAKPVNGYVTIERTWKKGDEIELDLPVQPRIIHANAQVKNLSGQVAIASGPIVYSLEGNKNPELDKLKIDTGSPIEMVFNGDMLGGINMITGSAWNAQSEKIKFSAIPYFAIGNIKPGDNYEVWINTKP